MIKRITAVPIAEISSDVAQPVLFEKKTNIGAADYPVRDRGNDPRATVLSKSDKNSSVTTISEEERCTLE